MTNCPKHPTVALICPACEGALGGSSASKAKVAAARKNGKKGGRPKGSKTVNSDTATLRAFKYSLER